MKGFKIFFEGVFKHQAIFDESFEKLYKKKYFGDIEKDEAKLRLTEWFNKFVVLVEHKMEEELTIALCSNNKENHIWFQTETILLHRQHRCW